MAESAMIAVGSCGNISCCCGIVLIPREHLAVTIVDNAAFGEKRNGDETVFGTERCKFLTTRNLEIDKPNE
jgi:hypothetical protein